MDYIIRIEPQWNVNDFKAIHSLFRTSIRIEPQWNVNENWGKNENMEEMNQNRTIVECKYKKGAELYKKSAIRIEPQWNVNTFMSVTSSNTAQIRIEPQWNVNKKYDIVQNLDILYQNRTIVECKFIIAIYKSFKLCIRIEPQWNVNVFLLKLLDIYVLLEQNHSGM